MKTCRLKRDYFLFFKISKWKNNDIRIYFINLGIFYQFEILIKKRLNLKNVTLIHGGGWKKLSDKKINNNDFKLKLKKILIFQKFNYYGMIDKQVLYFLNVIYVHIL